MIYFPPVSHLTSEQSFIFNINKAVAVEGGTATGKSTICLWKHILNIQSGKTSLFLVTSKSKAIYFKQACKQFGIVAYNSIQLAFTFEKNSIAQFCYDEIIIDDAEDLPLLFFYKLKPLTKSLSYNINDASTIFPSDNVSVGEMRKLFVGTCIRIWKKRNAAKLRAKGLIFGQSRSIFSTENSLGKIFNDCFSKLKTGCQEIISSFYYGHHSYEELAEKDPKNNPNSLKNKKYRCLGKLKSSIYKTLGSNRRNFVLDEDDIDLIDQYMVGILEKSKMMKFEDKLHSNMNFGYEFGFIQNVVKVVTFLEREKLREFFKSEINSRKKSIVKQELTKTEPMLYFDEIRAHKSKDNQVYVSIDDLMLNLEIEKAIIEFENFSRFEDYDKILKDLDKIKKETTFKEFDL